MISRSLSIGLFVLASIPALANPTGGVVTSGSATINPITGKTLTVNQTSQNAVINWQTFSIASGETTKFIQPSATSAVLNRVLGGQTSTISGTLSANGQVYLINGNGIYISGSGKVNTNAFIASTQDISDSDFLSGNLHFTGNSQASVQNLGTVNALGGNIYLIGQQVSNGGTLNALKGTVGLCAASDVVVAQQNPDGSTVTVNPSSTATTVNGNGVNNTGKINAAIAELRAANGNIYALAINNSGAVRATGVAKQGGHIWLTADSGSVKSTGLLATTAGGAIETSAPQVSVSGTVNTGKGGKWTVDPTDVVISTAASPTNLNAATIDGELNAGSNVTISAVGGGTDSGNIDVNAPLTWTSAFGLNLDASNNIYINSAITGTKGSLTLQAPNGFVLAPGAVSVSNFTLASGVWSQIVGEGNLTKLPTFSATNNFFVGGGATFARFAGGDGGGNPFQVIDIYGLQGIASGSSLNGNLQNDNYIVKNAINAAVTANWNSGEGFIPIQTFSGTFNGNKQTITGLTMTPTPGAIDVGLFFTVEASGLIENLTLANVKMSGLIFMGPLAEANYGTIANCTVSGTILGQTPTAESGEIGGLVGNNETTGVISNCSSSATVTVPVDTTAHPTVYIGGLVGNNSGLIINSTSSGKITINGNSPSGASNDLLYYGGLCGYNQGIIASSTNKGAIAINVPNIQYVGGLAGANSGTITASTNSGTITLVDNGLNIGGLIGGEINGRIDNSTNTGAILIKGPDVSEWIGGIAGSITGPSGVTECTNSGTVTVTSTAINNLYVGGLVGQETDSSSITGSANKGAITLNGTFQNVGGIVGNVDDSASITSCQNTGAIKDLSASGFSDVGGVVGQLENTSTLNLSSSSCAISSAGTALSTGGAVGLDLSTGAIANTTSAGTITASVGLAGIGGFVGTTGNGAIINNCTSSVASTLTFNTTISGPGGLGNFIGNNNATVTNCTSTGVLTLKVSNATGVNIAENIGGVAGSNQGTLTSCFNSGALNIAGNGTTWVGGVAGSNSGQILSCSNSGAINVTGMGAIDVGGVVGDDISTSTVGIRSASNSGVITVGTFATNVGGVIGVNTLGEAFDLFNTGAVKTGASSSMVGGVAGYFSGGTGEIMSNTGAVTVGITSSDVGGVAGRSDVALADAFNTGAISAGGTGIGGAVGYLSPTGFFQVGYNTGSVTATTVTSSDVGGLIGNNTSTQTDAVEFTYSTGKITNKGTVTGGLTGFSASPGVVVDSYWNVQTSGQTTSTGGTAVATTVLMDTQSTYAGFNFTGTWGILPASTPYIIDLQIPHNTGP